MSRRYQEQVEVRLGTADEQEDGPQVPTQFLWRGRVHLVRAVQGRWSQRVPWWRAASNAEDDGGAGGVLERQVWRVEASAGRAAGTGVYDLVQGEQWWLERVAD